MDDITRCISKRLITQSDSVDATFKGYEILNCSITPKGVVKAKIDENKGTISFTKYNSNWNGAVNFSLEAVDSQNENMHYLNNYNVLFGNNKSNSYLDFISFNKN